MNVRLEQYKIFAKVAELGSFSEAAKGLYITQSAVSQQIRLLEDELGVMLFVRGRKGTKLTSQGELLYNYVSRSLYEINSAENLFMRMKTLDEGNLRIGASDTITKHYLLPRLGKFHNKYPGIKIEIVNRVSGEALSRLLSGKVDVAFVNLPIENINTNTINVLETETLHDIFIAGESYSYLKDKVLSIKDISSLPLVMLEPRSNTRRTTESFFNKNGVTISPEFELGSHELLIDFAKNNLGIACITEEFTNLSANENVFKLKTDFSLPQRSIGICTLNNVSPSPAVLKLIEMF